MPQTGSTAIISYHTTTGAAAPSAVNLSTGELALNVTDLKIYTENGAAAVVQIGSGPSATDTFTNKTLNLTSNTLSGTTAQFNTALSDGDFATLAGTETLTNKTIDLTSNTLTATSLQLKTAVSDETGSGALVFATSPTLVTPVLGTPTSGNLSNCTADGTDNVGFLEVPQNSQSAAYTLVLADAGKHILHPSADTTARIFTIPANASVAFPTGTAVTFINQDSAGEITLSITTDTMRLAGAGTTGSRTLAANGVATAVKITSTEWIISGTNLT